MQLDLSAQALVNAGGALLFLLLGIGILLVARGSRHARLLGATAATFGLTYVLENLLVFEDGSFAASAILMTIVAPAAAFALLFVLDLSRGLPRSHARALAAYAVAAAAVLAAFGTAAARPDAAEALKTAGFPPPGGIGTIVAIAVHAQQLALALLVATAAVRFHAATGDANERRRAAAVGLAFGPFVLFLGCGASIVTSVSATGTGANIYNGAGIAYGLFTVAAIVPFAASRSATGAVRLVFPILWGIAAFSIVMAFAIGPGFTPDYGGYGIARSIGATILAYAILRGDLLGVPIPRLAMGRGAVGMGALATLFIVAEIAQNFLAAEYGLLTGGIVAGAFFFAATPIQRALDRRAALGSPAGARDAAEEAYRKAVRLALRDGVLTRDEEADLHDLAHDLGIDGPRAHRILADVEGGRKRAS